MLRSPRGFNPEKRHQVVTWARTSGAIQVTDSEAETASVTGLGLPTVVVAIDPEGLLRDAALPPIVLDMGDALAADPHLCAEDLTPESATEIPLLIADAKTLQQLTSSVVLQAVTLVTLEDAMMMTDDLPEMSLEAHSLGDLAAEKAAEVEPEVLPTGDEA